MQGMQWKLLQMWYGQPCKPILRWESISWVKDVVYQIYIGKSQILIASAAGTSNSDVVGVKISEYVSGEGWDRMETAFFHPVMGLGG